MNKNHSVILLLTVLSVITIGSCRHQPDSFSDPGAGGTDPGSGGGSGSAGSGIPCDPNTVYFKQQVLPILISNCAMSSCHDDASHQDGVVLTSYQKVMNTADIDPGRPGNSELYERITDNDPGDRMPRPPQNPLTQDQIQIVRKWIEQGAKDLVCDNMCDSSIFTFSGAVRIIISNKCQGCHSGTVAQAGIDFSSYSGVKAKADDGRLWGAVNHQPGFSAMPKNGAKLSDCEITQIRKWIEAGSPNN